MYLSILYEVKNGGMPLSVIVTALPLPSLERECCQFLLENSTKIDAKYFISHQRIELIGPPLERWLGSGVGGELFLDTQEVGGNAKRSKVSLFWHWRPALAI